MIHHKIIAQTAFTAPIILDPALDRLPEDYCASIKANSAIVLQEVTLLLQGEFHDLTTEPCLFLTTGSDGRFEKSNFSKVDLLFYYKGDTMDPARITEITQRIFRLLEKRPDLLSKSIEIKNLSTSDVFVCENETGKKPFFPTRCFDAFLLYGNQQEFDAYKDQVTTLTKAKITDFKDSTLRIAKEIVKKGYQKFKENTLHHFNIETGQLFYTLHEGLTARSTKHGHLRSVQYMVAIIIFNALLDKTITLDEYKDLPRTTEDRLLFLQKKSILKLNDAETQKLIKAYRYALSLYHLSEQVAKRNHEDTLQVTAKELKECTSIILNFLDTHK